MSMLVPALECAQPLYLAESPFHRLTSLSRSALATTRDLPAADRRLLVPHFVATFQWEAIRPLLPLRLDLPPDLPPWYARLCRSYYTWRVPDDVHSADDWKGLDDFDLVVSAQDVSHPKPHPESFARILEHFRLSPENAIYIGDSRVDEKFAANAGVPFVAYRNPELTADYYLDSFAAGPDLIRDLARGYML